MRVIKETSSLPREKKKSRERECSREGVKKRKKKREGRGNGVHGRRKEKGGGNEFIHHQSQWQISTLLNPFLAHLIVSFYSIVNKINYKIYLSRKVENYCK